MNFIFLIIILFYYTIQIYIIGKDKGLLFLVSQIKALYFGTKGLEKRQAVKSVGKIFHFKRFRGLHIRIFHIRRHLDVIRRIGNDNDEHRPVGGNRFRKLRNKIDYQFSLRQFRLEILDAGNLQEVRPRLHVVEIVLLLDGVQDCGFEYLRFAFRNFPVFILVGGSHHPGAIHLIVDPAVLDSRKTGRIKKRLYRNIGKHMRMRMGQHRKCQKKKERRQAPRAKKTRRQRRLPPPEGRFRAPQALWRHRP